MTATYALSDANGGTDVVGLHENLPPGLSPVDNEIGWRMSLARLASFVEHNPLDSEAVTARAESTRHRGQ